LADNEKGVELQQTLAQVGIEGIVNGMDETDWNPATDKYLEVPFDKASVHAGKAAAKEALQAECGLPVDPNVPLFGFIGRLEEQKGVDILMEALPGLVESTECQVVILGTGKKKMEKQLKALSAQFPGRVKGIAKFSTPLAHAINAGSDFLLVPSRFEPCGLIQLHAMQYGTVPIVATTGGLVDTVKEGVTGFHMGRMDPDDLVPADVAAVTEACVRAAAAYETEAFDGMVERCISQDLSWSKPAKKWEAALEEMMGASTVNPTPTEKKASVATPVATV
jgi:granule-bound starch synthase